LNFRERKSSKPGQVLSLEIKGERNLFRKEAEKTKIQTLVPHPLCVSKSLRE
jgi:hypothetical protein